MQGFSVKILPAGLEIFTENRRLDLAFPSNPGIIVQLSALTDEEIQNVLPETLPSYTEFTPTSKDELLKRIRKCRKNGYAYIINEYNQGDTGVSVPIYLESKLAGMLNIAGPTMRFTEERVLACIPELKKSALQISQELTS